MGSEDFEGSKNRPDDLRRDHPDRGRSRIGEFRMRNGDLKIDNWVTERTEQEVVPTTYIEIARTRCRPTGELKIDN